MLKKQNVEKYDICKETKVAKTVKVINKALIILVIIILLMLVLGAITKANAAVRIKEWKTDVLVKKNGDLEVSEYWDVTYSNITTLFRNFEKTVKIEDVMVTKLNDDWTELRKLESGRAVFKQQKGIFHSGIIQDKKEIGWGIENRNSSGREKYRIDYTIKDNITRRHKDVSEVYYKFLNEGNETASNSLTLNIKFEAGDVNKDNSLIYGHGILRGVIEFNNEGGVTAYTKPLLNNQMFEVRITAPSEYLSEMQSSEKNMKNEIMNEEAEFRGDKLYKTKSEIFKVLNIIAIGLGVLGIAQVIKGIFKRNQYFPALKKEKLDKEALVKDFEYYTEIPQKLGSNLVRATVVNNDLGTNNLFIAIILKLINLKIIETKMIKAEGVFSSDKTDYILNEEMYINEFNNLNPEDVYVYSLFKKMGNSKNYVTDKEFKKVVEKDYVEINSKLENLKKQEKENMYEQKELYIKNEELEEAMKNTSGNLWGGLLLVFIAFILLATTYGNTKLVFTFGVLSFVILLIVVILKIREGVYYQEGMTAEGLQTKKELQGLKKQLSKSDFVKEHSEKGVVVWEQYLIYASLFGIATKVLKNIQKMNPQLMEDLETQNPGFGNVMRNYAVFSASTVSHVSTGSGGGFSGGGGGGRRRRWSWW